MGTAAISFGPKLGLLNNAAVGETYYDQFRPFLRGVDALVQPSVIDYALTDPPVSPNDGDAYLLLQPDPTGAWDGHEGQVAVWSTQVTDSGGNVLDPAWDFYTPRSGWFLWTVSLSAYLNFDGNQWNIFGQLSGSVLLNPPSYQTINQPSDSSLSINGDGFSVSTYPGTSSPTGIQIKDQSSVGTIVSSEGVSSLRSGLGVSTEIGGKAAGGRNTSPVKLLSGLSFGASFELSISGGMGLGIQSSLFSVDTGSGSFSQVLPDATTYKGSVLILKKTTSDANTCTLTPAAGNVIDNGSSYVLSTVNQFVVLAAMTATVTGVGLVTGWWVIGKG